MQSENFTNKQLKIINKVNAFAKANLYALPGEPDKKFPLNDLVKINFPTKENQRVSYDVRDYPDRMLLPEFFKKYPNSNIIKLNSNGFLSVVIDIDKKDGKFSNEALAITELLKDYPTYVVETPSGGLHYHYIIDPARPLVGRIIGYKEGVDIILDGGTPLPPSTAWSDKLGAVGEYTERDPIEINPPTLFPYEVFPDLIDTPENREKHGQEKKVRIQEQLDKGEIAEYRNDTFHHLSVALNSKFPKNPSLVWDIVKWLYDNRTKKEGFSLNELETTFKSALNGKVVAEAREYVQEEINKDVEKFGDPPVVFWNQLKDYDIPETSFLVTNLIVEKGINYIYGKPGVCKTWLAQYLALCIARGIPAFGKFLTKQCKILFVDKDNDPYQMKLRVGSLGGLETDQVAFYLDSGLFRVENEESVKRLIACIKEHKFGLVVFDTARDIHKGEEDSSTEINKLNQVFKRIIQAGCAVLVISHTKKGEGGDLIDLLRGSSALGGAAASMIHVSQPNESTVILQMGKCRYVKKIPPIELNILQNNNGITGFEYKGVAKIEPIKKSKDELAEHILKLVKGFPAPGLTRKDLIQALQKNGKPSESTIDRRVNDLEVEGLIKKDDEGNVMFRQNTS
ncbi:MAG: AAA family ATPase [Candidatus Melainabacteria bacterium]|nr:AAA family ATPase [Candidatus Melainabacteria bacterium]